LEPHELTDPSRAFPRVRRGLDRDLSDARAVLEAVDALEVEREAIDREVLPGVSGDAVEQIDELPHEHAVRDHRFENPDGLVRLARVEMKRDDAPLQSMPS
jgi:hypothetical protein